MHPAKKGNSYTIELIRLKYWNIGYSRLFQVEMFGFWIYF